jgi:hypothetical protein
MGTKTYDAKSYELAEHFLRDHPSWRGDLTKHTRLVHKLAITIQEAVEDFLWHEEQSDGKA